MSIFWQIILGISIIIMVVLFFHIIEFIVFHIVNREAHREYFGVLKDIKENKIPENDSEFITYNQQLTYISVKKTFSFFVDKNDKRVMKFDFYVTDPYTSYINSCKGLDLYSRIFENNIFNWTK